MPTANVIRLPSRRSLFTRQDRQDAADLACSFGSAWSVSMEADDDGDEALFFSIALDETAAGDDDAMTAFSVATGGRYVNVMDWRRAELFGHGDADDMGRFASVAQALAAIRLRVETWGRALFGGVVERRTDDPA